MGVNIPEEVKEQAKKSIMMYFERSGNIKIDDEKAEELLNFMMNEVGNTSNTKGIDETRRLIEEKLRDMGIYK